MKFRGLTQKRGVYYYRPLQVDGKRPNRVSLRTKDLQKALARAQEYEQRYLPPHGRGSSCRSHRTVHGCSKVTSGIYTVKTRSVTESTLRLFCEWVGNPKIGDVSRKHFEQWRDQLLKDGRKPSGVVT